LKHFLSQYFSMTEHRDLHSMATVREEQARRDKHQRRLLRTYLPELVQLERTLTEAPAQFAAQVETRIHTRELNLPLYRIEIGQPAKDRPVFLLVGGVHGLERIGTQVILSWLQALSSRLRWDRHLENLLEQVQ